MKLGMALSRVRFQLLGGLFFGVILPHLIQGRYDSLTDSLAAYDNTLIGTFCALLIGYLFFRKMTAMPGVNATTNVIPSFVVSYGIVSSIYFGLRLDFSRYEFVLSFALLVLFFLTTLMVISKVRKPVFGIVPFGLATSLKEINRVGWVTLRTPEQAEKYPDMAIINDFQAEDIPRDWQRYLAETAVRGRSVFHATQIRESIEGKVQIEHLAQNTMGHLAPDSIYAPGKRYVDFACALVLLIVLSPALMLVALLIRLSSPGPAIFKQVRMGYRGQEFTVYKFRSMRIQDPNQVTIETDMTRSDDDRINAIGRFIRKTRVDELPQLFNILRGEMSWIGPRPETLNLSMWYETEIPFYRYRHIVRPGITGWAQVEQGHVTSVDDVREKLEYDFYYVKHFSIWLDIMIVIKTIRIVITGTGAK